MIRKKLSRVSGDHAVSDRAGNIDVVAGFVIKRSEIGFDLALAAMDEVQLVAIGVAEIERHRLRAARDVEPDVAIAEKRDRHAFGVREVGGLELVQIEAVRPELAFKANPAGGRMRVIEMSGFAVESLAPMLFFEGPFGQADVGLVGGFAFLERIHGLSPDSSIGVGRRGSVAGRCTTEICSDGPQSAGFLRPACVDLVASSVEGCSEIESDKYSRLYRAWQP